jgi:hypothetical protein
MTKQTGKLSRRYYLPVNLSSGWDACLGQAWSVNDGTWARWGLRDYNRIIDFDTISSRHSAQQRAGMDAHACDIRPAAFKKKQSSSNLNAGTFGEINNKTDFRTLTGGDSGRS